MLLSDAAEALRARVAGIAERWYFPASAALLLFCVAWIGLGTLPHDEYLLAAQNPFESLRSFLYPVRNYFQQSPLLPLTAYAAGLTSKAGFVTLCLGFIVLGFGAFASLARVRYGRELGLIAAALALSHPVTLVMLSWVGTPDGITFLLTACLLFARSSAWIAILCTIGAFNHPVMVFAAPVILVLRATSGEKECGFRQLLPAAAGLALGTAAVYLFLWHYKIGVFSRLDCIGTRTLGGWIKLNLTSFPLTLYSLHGPIWLALAAAFIAAFSLDRRYFIVFILCQLLFYGITFFTEDTTRVFSLLTWAAAIHCILHAARLLEAKRNLRECAQYRAALIVIAIFGLLGPHYYLWNSTLRIPNFTEFWQSIAGALT